MAREFPVLEARLDRVKSWVNVVFIGGAVVGSAAMLAKTTNYSALTGHNFDFETKATSGHQRELAEVVGMSRGTIKDAGEWVAPYFAIGMVFFLMAFAAYFVLAIVALVLDFEAMDAACAADSWVWLYVLLVVVIPTSLGFVMGLVKTGLNMADLKGNFGWGVPAVFLSLPGPILYIVLGVLGWVGAARGIRSSPRRRGLGVGRRILRPQCGRRP